MKNQIYIKILIRILIKYLFEAPSEQDMAQLYDKLLAQGSLEFYSTSFLRGQTFDRSIIIVDEASNMIFQELGYYYD